MARDFDIIDIIIGQGPGRRGGPRGLFDELAERLASGYGGRFASGGYVRAPTGDISDILAAVLAPSMEDHVDDINAAIDMLMRDGTFKRLEPVTKRSRVQINGDTVYIGHEGFPEGHPHVNILTRHVDPKKRDRWRLWSFCPRHSRTNAFLIKGTEDIAEAERVANIVLDIGLHVFPVDKLVEAALASRKDRATARDEMKPKPPAAAEPMPDRDINQPERPAEPAKE